VRANRSFSLLLWNFPVERGQCEAEVLPVVGAAVSYGDLEDSGQLSWIRPPLSPKARGRRAKWGRLDAPRGARDGEGVVRGDHSAIAIRLISLGRILGAQKKYQVARPLAARAGDQGGTVAFLQPDRAVAQSVEGFAALHGERGVLSFRPR